MLSCQRLFKLWKEEDPFRPCRSPVVFMKKWKLSQEIPMLRKYQVQLQMSLRIRIDQLPLKIRKKMIQPEAQAAQVVVPMILTMGMGQFQMEKAELQVAPQKVQVAD